MAFVKTIYDISRSWPPDERFGLIAQARNAAVSIPANLAEGRGRGSAAEMRRFAQIALGSCYELDTLITIAADLKFETPQRSTDLRETLSTIARRIQSFIRYQQSRAR